MALNQPDQALKSFRTSIFYDPNNPKSYYGIGNVLMNQGLLVESLANFKIAKSYKNDSKMNFFVGLIEFKLNDINCIDSFTRSISLDSFNNQLYYYHRAQAFLMGNEPRYQDALNDLMRILDYNGAELGSGNVYRVLANVYEGIGEVDKAREARGLADNSGSNQVTVFGD